MKKTAKQIYDSYKIKAALIAVAYVAALAVLFWVTTVNTFVGIALIVILAASVRAPFEKLRETHLENVMFEQLDAKTFSELASLGAFKGYNRLEILAAMSIGDYEKILALVEESEKKTNNPVEKCNNLYRKGYVYFEKGEFDKLPGVVREYESLKRQNPKFVQIFNSFTVFDKFDAFADEDYEYVVDVCDIDLAEINPKRQNHKLTRINVSFYRAVSLYKMGEIEKAREGFKNIIEFAPNMHKAKLAAGYLEKMD